MAQAQPNWRIEHQPLDSNSLGKLPYPDQDRDLRALRVRRVRQHAISGEVVEDLQNSKQLEIGEEQLLLLGELCNLSSKRL